MAKHDDFYLKLVDDGVIKVTKFGEVFNKKGKRIGTSICNGYYCISREIKGKSKKMYIHHLVWLVFKGPIPEKYEINHENGDKLDNILENLRPVTSSENKKHAHDTGLHDRNKLRASLSGQNSSQSKLTNDQVAELRQLYKDKKFVQTELAKMFGVSQAVVSKIILHQTYTGEFEDKLKPKETPLRNLFIAANIDYCTEIEKIFISFVKDDIIRVTPFGNVFRNDRKKWIGSKSSDGYMRTSITINGIRYGIKTHRLVALVYIGNILDGMVVNHKNLDKSDNRLENLEIITIGDNNIHRINAYRCSSSSKNSNFA